MDSQLNTGTTLAPSASPLNFTAVLQVMLGASNKVSDLIFSPGRPPQIEIGGKLHGVEIPNLGKLSPSHTAGIAKFLIGNNKHAAETLDTQGSADLSFSAPGVSRFRVNIFKQRGTHAIVMRVIPASPPRWTEVNLPAELMNVVELKNGIVVVTGPAGSGKSTTLAAIVDLINESKFYHIITIEDPIEFVHNHKNSTIHQRELHSDTPGFATALRSALRQAPAVILVGELRDRETIEVALEAAETGHLVLTSMPTADAAATIGRLVNAFPQHEEQAARLRLARAFRYVVSQRLLPRADGQGRVAAIEILKSTAQTRECVEKGEGEGRSLLDIMANGEHEGMQNFDKVIAWHVQQGVVRAEEAWPFAVPIEHPEPLEPIEEMAAPETEVVVPVAEPEVVVPVAEAEPLEPLELQADDVALEPEEVSMFELIEN
jgi:twitching motility protein PilT